MHTSCIEGEPFSPRGDPGNTRTAFGSHEWLNNDNTGETASPIWVRFGVVRVCVFVENLRAQIVKHRPDWGIRMANLRNEIYKITGAADSVLLEVCGSLDTEVLYEGVG